MSAGRGMTEEDLRGIGEIVTAAELRKAGFSAARLRWLIERGLLRPVARGAYAGAVASHHRPVTAWRS
jgi:hypothetical protein